jgi:hypothetical protein
MPPAWSTSTATRRPWETTSLKKFMVYSTSGCDIVMDVLRKVYEYDTANTRAWGGASLWSPRGVPARGHGRRQSCSYATLFQKCAAGHAGDQTICLGLTSCTKADTKPRESHDRAPCQERRLLRPASLPSLCLSRRVINSSYRAPQPEIDTLSWTRMWIRLSIYLHRPLCRAT